MSKRGRNDLTGQLGSFLRNTLHQLGTVREVVAQKSKAGRLQLDLALLRRRRKEALAELGTVVVALAEKGQLTEDDFPELGVPLARLGSIDEQIAEAERRARGGGEGLEPDDPDRWRHAGERWEEDDDEGFGDEDDLRARRRVADDDPDRTATSPGEEGDDWLADEDADDVRASDDEVDDLDEDRRRRAAEDAASRPGRRGAADADEVDEEAGEDDLRDDGAGRPRR